MQAAAKGSERILHDIACMRAAKVEEDAQTAPCNPICDSSGPGHSVGYGL